MAHGSGHSVDEYLETIYFLAFPIGEYRPATGSTAIASRVAEMLERINDRLGSPDRCPHGWPVDTEFEQAENAELVALAELEVGKDGRIVRLAEHDGDLLHWFYDEGLVPGSEVAVVSAQPAAGQLTIAVGGAERAISERAADGI